jgi:hypothetical protein
LLSDKIIELMNDHTKSESLALEYKDQIKLFDPKVMASNVSKVYKVAGF